MQAQYFAIPDQMILLARGRQCNQLVDFNKDTLRKITLMAEGWIGGKIISGLMDRNLFIVQIDEEQGI